MASNFRATRKSHRNYVQIFLLSLDYPQMKPKRSHVFLDVIKYTHIMGVVDLVL